MTPISRRAFVMSAMLLAALLLPATFAASAAGAVPAAQATPTPDWDAPHVPGQLLVGFVADGEAGGAATAAAIAEGEAALSARGMRVVEAIPELGLALVAAPEAGVGELEAAAADLASDPAIAWAEPNFLLQLDLVPNDPSYESRQAAVLTRIAMPEAWDLTLGRPEVVIAVLDTGVDMNHPDLYDGIWRNPGEIAGNGLDDDGNGFLDDVNGWDFAGQDDLPDDDHGHGTHVAGIAAARTNNGIGIAGMAGMSTIMPVDVFTGGLGTYEDLIRAIVYATDNGAAVINMSLGASSYSRGEEVAVNYAWSHGVVVVAAAGNTCISVDDGKPPCVSDHYPAAHQNVIAVAATTSGDSLASFSTRGTFVDVAAPGVAIYSTYRGGGYATLSGTSMATPHVSGLAALLLARNPKLTPDQVRALIETTAQDLGFEGQDIQFGHGRINAWRALTGTAADPDPYPMRPPAPPLDLDLPGCTELIPDGGFEAGAGQWASSGSALVDTTRNYSGTQALHFPGGPDVGGAVTRTLSLPERPRAAMLRFAYRIENNDTGWGTDPAQPYDDWLTVEFRDAGGALLSSLLRTGNTADTAADGLPWDRYIYRMEEADLAALKAASGPRLVIRAQNDSDNARTEVWVDEVQLCVQSAPALPNRWWFPFIRE